MKIPVAEAQGKSATSSSSPARSHRTAPSHQQRLQAIPSPLFPLGDDSSSFGDNDTPSEREPLCSRWQNEEHACAPKKQRSSPQRSHLQYSEGAQQERPRPRKRNAPSPDSATNRWSSYLEMLTRNFMTPHDRRSSAVILGVLAIMLLPFLAAIVTAFWDPGERGVEPLARQALSRLLNWNNSTEAKWVDHLVMSYEKDTTSIDILDTFHSRLNAELGPLISKHAAEIWNDTESPVLKCMSTEKQIVSFSIKKSSRLPAVCRFEEREINKTIRDIRDLRISFPRKSSQYMLRVKIAEERTSHGESDIPRRFHSWGKFREKFSVELLDTGKLALQRFCGENNHDVDMEPVNSKDIRLMSILELKRLNSLWTSGRVVAPSEKGEKGGNGSIGVSGHAAAKNEEDDVVDSVFRAVISPSSLTSNNLLSLLSVRHVLNEGNEIVRRNGKSPRSESAIQSDSFSTENDSSEAQDLGRSESNESLEDDSMSETRSLGDKSQIADQSQTKTPTSAVVPDPSRDLRPSGVNASVSNQAALGDDDDATLDEEINLTQDGEPESQGQIASRKEDSAVHTPPDEGGTLPLEVPEPLAEAGNLSVGVRQTPAEAIQQAGQGDPPIPLEAPHPPTQAENAPVGVQQPPVDAVQHAENDGQLIESKKPLPEVRKQAVRPAIVVQPTSDEGLFPKARPPQRLRSDIPGQRPLQQLNGALPPRQFIPPGVQAMLPNHPIPPIQQQFNGALPPRQFISPGVQAMQPSHQIPPTQQQFNGALPPRQFISRGVQAMQPNHQLPPVQQHQSIQNPSPQQLAPRIQQNLPPDSLLAPSQQQNAYIPQVSPPDQPIPQAQHQQGMYSGQAASTLPSHLREPAILPQPPTHPGYQKGPPQQQRVGPPFYSPR